MHPKATIIKDSINSATEDRLTTFVVTYPRFINAEVLRHRMLSFSSASSRAIPLKKVIKSIQENPAEPVFWGANQSGMQASIELDDSNRSHKSVPSISYIELSENGQFLGIELSHIPLGEVSDRKYAKEIWKSAQNAAIAYAKALESIGLHKQIANRILEPFQNITLIITGTDWENFFKLRAAPEAQPEFRELAEEMLSEYNKSQPETIKAHLSHADIATAKCSDLLLDVQEGWHIPFSDRMPEHLTWREKLKVAVARCARISYMTQDGVIDPPKDFELYNRLTQSGHYSPCEHVALAVRDSAYVGNFKGWYQLRKMLPNENQKDSRVIKKAV